MTHITAKFDAEDFWSRFGFGDGDVITLIGEENLTDNDYNFLLDNCPLERILKKYLIPEIERVTKKSFPLMIINSSTHNPYRFKYMDKTPCPENVKGVSITLTLDQIMECAK